MSKRIDFAIVNGVVAFKDADDLDVTQWLQKMFGMTLKEVEDTIYGSIFHDKIVICKGIVHTNIDMDELSAKQLLTIMKKYTATFGMQTVFMYNGYKGVLDQAEDYRTIQTIGYGCFTEWK